MNDDEVQAFSQQLRALKRKGCNLLVTGDVREEVSQRMTRKMLGAGELPRTRVLALTNQDWEDVPDLLPGNVDATNDDVYVVDYSWGNRTPEAVAPSPGASDEWGCHDLADLQTTVCNAITVATDAESGFDPAEFRFSLFTLSALTRQHELDAVERFASAVCDHVRGVSGMGHYHLPVPDDSPTVERLAPLFDARIELREQRGRPEQRWHVPERDAPTEWVGL